MSLNVTEILERLDELSVKVEEKTTEITHLRQINTQQVVKLFLLYYSTFYHYLGIYTLLKSSSQLK